MDNKCDQLVNSAKRIEGQLRGIQKMILEGKDGKLILTQVTAARAALSRLAIDLLKDESRECLNAKTKKAKSDKFEELVSSLFKLT